MENKNLRNPGVPYATSGVPQGPAQQAPTPLFADVTRSTPTAPVQPTTPPLTTTPVTAVPTTPIAAPLPPATPPPVSAPIVNPVSPKPPKKPRDWRRTILLSSFGALFLLFIGATILIFEAVSNSNNNQEDPVNSELASTSIPLSEFAASGSLNLLGTQSLAVNGQLRANESFVLAPQAQPSKSERGQLYFDANTNRLAYYNGSQFVQIPGDEEEVSSVLTLQGQSGNITLVGGEGVAVDGTTLTNTGVTSIGGSTGDITLGPGVAIVDGALTNSGIVGATAGSGISVVDDGNGNITISTSGAGTGTVTSPNGTPGRIAKFTGVQTIEDSLLSEAGSAVTVNGDLNVSGNTTLANALGVNSGGTGATSFTANGVIIGNGSGALTAVAAGGPNECLMSTAGAPVFQACPGGGGGVTALNGLAGSLTIANATAAGSTITLDDASTSQKGIAQFNGTNFSVASGVVNTIQDISVAAAPTFGRLTLTSSQATSPMLLVNNTNGAGTGNLIDLQVGGVSRMAVSPAGNMTLTGTVNGQTISSAASFTGTLAVTGAANLNGGATVAGTLTANTITPTAAMTVGATGQSLTLQGNAGTTLSATNGANTTSLTFQSPTANVNYRLLTAAAGTYDICTTAANCAGIGGGVTTSGGTTNRLPKFTGAQTLGDSIISDNGSTVSIGGILAVNTITPTGAMTIGSTGQALTLQGTTTSLSSTSGGITNTLTFATPSGSNKTITVPNASGTVVVSASGPLAIDAAGNITCATCATAGSGVTSLNGLAGALSLAYATGSGSTVTIQDASTSQKGVAQFNSTNFSVASGVVNTIQDINVAAAPTFGRLTVTSSQASNAMLLINNTNAGATGNLLDVQLNGSSRLAVSPAGNMTLVGTINGQTISSAANLTGTLAVAGAANLNGGATVTGTLTANTITPTSALTVGATTQSFLMQGNASSTITATSGANTTTVAFQTPTANVTYRLLTAATGTYDICTSVGNCAGAGGGVTTSGGTTNRLAKFTGSQAIGDSIITDNGTTVTIGGTLAVNTITPSAAMTIGATSQNLTLQGADTTITETAGGITNSLVFAAPSGSNKTITLPNASGTVAVSASGPLAIDAAGNITCATCAIAGSGVTSLNSLTGALTIANASTAGSTITINDASTSQKGIAQFNSTNFSVSGGVVNTIQDIAVTSAPTFGRLTVTSSQASNAMFLVNNTNAGATGNLLDLQQNGVSRLAVSPAGAMTLTGTLNGQTISSAANFTGTLGVTGAATLSGGATVTGTLTANTITPTSSLTVGATNQSFLVQGSAGSTITATNGANTTTLAFQNPTAAVTYRFLTAAAGTYDVCTTVGNCAGVGGGVTTAGGTTNTLAKFTGSGSIGDSSITDDGTTVTIGGTLAVNTLTPTAALTVGATSQNLTMQGAAVNLTSTAGGFTNTLSFVTPSGSNKTITVPNASGTLVVSASGPLAIDSAGNITCATCASSGSGVTSLNGIAGALTIASASGSGSTITIDDASTSQKGIAQFNSTNFSASGGVVNTIQDISIAAAPTFGRLTVTSSQASNAMLLINNTNAGASGNLLDVQLNGASRLSVNPAGAMTVAGTVNGQTISSAASFTGTLAVAGAASLNGGATVTGTLTANTITPTSALTVGATNQSFLVQGNASSTITATSGASTTTVAFQTPTANVTYRLLTAAAGTYDICTTVGNCAGVGGGVTTAGGTTNRLAKFSGTNSIADSIITDNGTTVTVGGTLAVNTITPSAAMTIGSTSQNLTLQGANTSLTSTGSGFTNTLTFAAPSGSNKTITIPNATGTVAVSASGPLAIDAAGNITCATCATTGGSVASLNGLTGALSIANATAAGSTITINDASTSQKGIAQFNSSNFSVASGVVNTIQDIGVAAAPTFGRLTVTSSQASNAMFLINNTNASGSGNLLDVQLNGSSRLAVNPAGAMTLTGTLNGQTISSAASFTGTLAVAGAASLNGGATVTGTLTANTITPTSSLTVGATNQSFLVQGSATSTITATSGANTTTLAFQSPTAAVTYRFLTAAAGTYDVCTTAANCVGIGGGVTSAGGTTNQLAKFTGANAIGDSIISDDGTTVTIGGTLAVNTLTPTAALTIGATSQDLTMQGATVNLTSTAGGFTNALTFATPSGSNKTITLPNASGTLVVSASGPLAIDSAGNITCATCATTSGSVASLNGLTGALTLANATAAGSTVTINDASTSQKGIAQFNSTNFSASGGVVNTIQNINTTAAPQFGQLTLTSSQASAAMIVVNNTNVSASGNLLDLQQNGVSRLAVSPAGAMTIASTINGQTISSAASFSGTLAVTGAANLNGGATVTGTLSANNLTPSSALTVGATGQSFLVQGNASSTITATNSGSTTTLSFQTPTANVNYRFLTAAAGTYDICTTAANCAGIGGGVTTAGGTSGKIAKFTGTGTIGDSIMTESGTTVSVAGTLAATTSVQTALLDTASAAALNIGTTNATAINLNKATTVTGALTQSSGAITLTGNAASSLTTSSGALTLTSAAAATWGTTAGMLTLRSVNTNTSIAINGAGNTITLATGTAGTITVGSATTSTVNIGAQTDDARTVNVGFPTATTSQTVNIGASAGTAAVTVRSGTGGIILNSSSTIELQDATNVTGSFIAQNASSVDILTADATGSQVILGQSSSLTGKLVFAGATGNNTITVIGQTNPAANRTITLPDESGTICTTGSVCSGYAAASGSGSYIQNTTTQQTANMNIISAAAGSVAARIEGAANQSTQVLLVRAGSSPTANAFEVQNSSGNQIFAVDPQNTRVVVGSGGSCTTGRLCVGQSTTGTGGGTATNLHNVQNASVSTVSTFVGQNIVINDTSTSIANVLNPLVLDTTGTTNTSATVNSLTAKVSSGQSGNFLTMQNGATNVLTLSNYGVMTLQPTVASTSAFSVKTTLGNNAFIVDNNNGRAGIAIDSSTPNCANECLEIKGALKLRPELSNTDTYVTPLGASVNTAINIVNFNPGDYGQVVAMGLNSSASATARVLSLFDNRAQGHQPTLALLSPDQNEIFGLSWDGSNTNSYVSTSAQNLTMRVWGSDVATFNANAITLAANTTLQSGINFTVTDGLTTLGGALQANTNVTLGDASSDLVTINGVVQGASPLVFEGATSDGFETTLAITDPTADRTITLPDASGTVCLQNSSSCGFATSSTAFIQGGNSFGATAYLGTNDSNSLAFKTNNAVQATMAVGGATLFQNTVDSNFAFEVRSSANPILRIDSSNRKVAIGDYSAVAADNIAAQLQVLPTTTGRPGITVTSPASYGSNFYEAIDSTGSTMFRVQFNGAVTTALGVFTSNPQSAGSTNSVGSTFGSGAVSGATSASGSTTLKSGNSTTSGNTGSVAVLSGNATSGNSGSTTIDTGTASGTAGQIYIGTSNTSAVNIGRSGINTTVNGSLVSNTVTSSGAMTVGNAAQTLGIQGTTTTITSGSTIVKPTGTSTSAFQVQNSSSTPLLTVNGSTNNVAVANKLTVGSFDGAGLADCDASNSKLLWDVTTSQFSCGTDRASFTVRRTADETVTNSIVLQDDNYFTFSVGANETWAFQMFYEVNSSSTANWRMRFDAPTGATCDVYYNNIYNVTSYYADTCNEEGTINNGSTWDNSYITYGTVATGGTAGTVKLRWAQDVASGSTILRRGGYMVAYKLSGADMAEAYYTKDSTVGPADIVQVDGSLKAGVKKSDKAYSQSTLGVVSTEPGFVLGDPKDALSTTGKPVLLALNGRVPVKVSTENGPVKAGDYLTASSTPGVAMKATKPGQMIGTALEDFDTNAPSGMGLVNVFVNPMWATPDTSGLQLAGDASDIQGQKATTFNETVDINGKLTVKDTLTVDPDKRRVVVGKENGDAYGTLLVLGNKTTAGDPEGTNGAMYYNAAANKFRCFEGDTWKDCVGGEGGSTSVSLLANGTPLPDCTLTSTIRALGDCISAGAANRFIAKADLSSASQARIVASGYDALSGGHIRLQYSSDGKSWKYLSGSNGPDLSTDTSPNNSDWANLNADAKKDVWIRAVVDGSGTLTSLTNVTAQFR